MTLLQGRRGLIVGIANTRSIAYGIAQVAKQHGAELILTYQNERLKNSVEQIGAQLGAARVEACDVTDANQITALVQCIEKHWGCLDFVVHAVAYAEREDLAGRFVQTQRAGFLKALDVSVYSLIALAQATEPLLARGQCPSLLTLTYLGASHAIVHYNVMGVAKAALEASVRYLAADLGPQGIRINALSAGPVRTLSASGVRGLRAMLNHTQQSSPLRRNVDLDDLGRAAVFALSDLGSGMTGETFHVDAGYHCVAAPGVDIPGTSP